MHPYWVFFAAVSAFAFVDLRALRDFELADFVDALDFAGAAAVDVDFEADFAERTAVFFAVVSCFPCCAACAWSCGATASMRAAAAAANVMRFMQLPPKGVGEG
jgi:hypothetical protein